MITDHPIILVPDDPHTGWRNLDIELDGMHTAGFQAWKTPNYEVAIRHKWRCGIYESGIDRYSICNVDIGDGGRITLGNHQGVGDQACGL